MNWGRVDAGMGEVLGRARWVPACAGMTGVGRRNDGWGARG